MEIGDFNMDYFSLSGQVAFVTGGNSGLGRAFSVALATAGAKIFSVSLDGKGDEETRRLVRAKSSDIFFMEIDITEDGAPQKAIDRCLEVYGQINILMNNAGLLVIREFPSFDRASWDKMLAVNLTAAYELSNRVGQLMMKQRQGKIIATGSLFSHLGVGLSPAYSATKHGIVGLTKAYCDELAQYNVQCNAIAPGYFKTELTKRSQEDPERNQWIASHAAVNRWGDVAELMGAVVFLASRASDFVNGVVLPVDGGFLVR